MPAVLKSRPYVVLGLAVASVLLALYAVFDPSEAVWMPKCPFHLLTGLDCPGCGSQRALHALLHGDLSGALTHNALMLVMLPLIGLIALAEVNRRRWPRLFRLTSGAPFIYSILGAVVAWAIIRNLIF